MIASSSFSVWFELWDAYLFAYCGSNVLKMPCKPGFHAQTQQNTCHRCQASHQSVLHARPVAALLCLRDACLPSHRAGRRPVWPRSSSVLGSHSCHWCCRTLRDSAQCDTSLHTGRRMKICHSVIHLPTAKVHLGDVGL